MIFSEKLVQNIKKLRTTYAFSIKNISDLLELKTTSAIGNIETYKGLPSAQLLFRLTEKFGISLDWLFGISQTPYTDSSIEAAENELENKIATNETAQTDMCELLQHSDWVNPDKRRKEYSLAVRANIVTLASWELLKSEETTKSAIDELRYNVLKGIVKSPSHSPVYDLEEKK